MFALRYIRILWGNACCARDLVLRNEYLYPQPLSVMFGQFMSKLASNSSNDATNNRLAFDGVIPLDEIDISYSSSSGPGGQHVNKTRSKVQIKFHVASAKWIPENLKPYLFEKESHRITKDGFFVIQSDKTRVQLINQADCLERVRRMIRERLSEMNKPETPAKTLEKYRLCQIRENEKRLALKRATSMTKAYRQRPSQWDL